MLILNLVMSLPTVKTVGKFEFFYAEPSVIKAPDKEIPVEEMYSFITKDNIQTIYRAASAISAPFLRVVGSGSEVFLPPILTHRRVIPSRCLWVLVIVSLMLV